MLSQKTPSKLEIVTIKFFWIVKQRNAIDLRKGRYSENNRIYLVTTATRQRQKVFTNFSLGRLVVYAMRHQHQQQKVNSLAFVIMPDHIHWLFAL